MDSLHVVLGATGGAGSAVVRELVARGLPTRALGRKAVPFPEGVDYVRGDATDPATLRRVCKGATVVYHCINVPYAHWERTLPQLAQRVLEACADEGARLVVMDNLYMYGPVEGPITEEAPRRAAGPKGRLRAQLEETFLNAHRERKVDVCIARARRWMVALAGLFSPDLRQVGEVLYQFERPFIVDASKFQRAFGGRVTPHEQAIRETSAAWNGGRSPGTG